MSSRNGIGSYSRMLNFCKQTNPQPWTCINQFINIIPAPVPVPVPGKMKTVFLLELTDGFVDNDLIMQNTLNYYWNTYPQEFIKCPIIDTQGSLVITLELLDEYYNYGFKFFVGFSRSTVVNDVLDWFNLHADAIGISATSTAPSLNVPKNIFRMTPNDHYMIDSIMPFLEGKTVNYIYSVNEYAPVNLIPYIQDISGVNLVLYPIQNTSDLDALVSLNIGHDNEIMLIYIITDRQYYLDLFLDSNPVLTYSNTQYDITGVATPKITNSSVLNNKYNTSLFKGIETSILWRNGYNTLLSNNFSIVIPNVLNVLNQYLNNQIIDNINSHYGSLQFDSVTKDILYYSFLIEKYNGTDFININLSVNDPYLGKYIANFVSNTPVSTSIIPVSPNKAFTGKVIAFLEIEFPNGIENLIYQSLYYFWYKDASLPKFPIIDISGLSSLQVANLLTTYYNQGYRVFLGPNLGHTLATSDVLNWFAAYQNTICISLLSGVAIPNIPLNIYRLTSKISDVVPLFASLINSHQKIYYIYELDDPAGTNLNQILQYLFGPTHIYKSFAIDASGNNLTVSSMLNFFGVDPSNNPVTTSDIVIIFSNLYLQNYINLYNDVSMNQIVAPQYIGSFILNLNVPINGTVLNKNLYALSPVYPNTSYLWNENTQYLINKYFNGLNINSYGTINALKMIKYILEGKDIKLLGSHIGILQFSSVDNNIMFPSFLLERYQSLSNAFVNYEITFQDPLLGNFSAFFIQ
jgi:hypothetical protein